MTVYEEAQIAISFWCQGRQITIPNSIERLLGFVFYTLDSLYDVTRKLPTKKKSFEDIPLNHVLYFFVIGLPEKEYYSNLRLTLSLVSDLYFLLEGLLKQGNLREIQPIVEIMKNEARKFDEIRNFYTHLNERISDLETHGIDGTADTKCGIKYTNVEKCFHLVVGEGEIHFSDYKKSKDIDISKDAFDPIFVKARELFVELTNNKLPNGRKTFPSPKFIYPL